MVQRGEESDGKVVKGSEDSKELQLFLWKEFQDKIIP